MPFDAAVVGRMTLAERRMPIRWMRRAWIAWQSFRRSVAACNAVADVVC